MKNLMLFAVLGALSLSTVAQAGQDQAEQPVISIIANGTKIELPANYRKMWPNDFYNYKNAYTLSNGMTLSIFSRGNNMYAMLDDQVWHKIVAVSPNIFVSMDRQLKMHINLLENGEVSGELLMVMPAQNLANNNGQGENVLYATMR